MAEEKSNSNVGLNRFITAQDGQRGDGTLYELALKEIQEGELGFECWIRYVYPQLKRKGTSQLTDLGVMKLRTCMLLFASISDEPVFKQVLRKYGWK